MDVGKGMQKLTVEFKLPLARWVRRMSWKKVSEAFQTSWDHVYQSVKYIVVFRLVNRNLDNFEAIRVDEVHMGRGIIYTLVYQLDSNNKRLLYIGKNRKSKTLLRFFYQFGK